MSNNPKKPANKKAAKKKAPAKRRPKPQVIDPARLIVQEMQTGMQLWYYGKPILLTNGQVLTHPRLALVEHIREELSGFGTVTLDPTGRILKPDMISSYVLLSNQRIMEANNSHPFVAGFGKWLLLDPCLCRCPGPEVLDQLARWVPLSRYFEEEGIKPPDFLQIPVKINEEDDVDSILMKRFGSMMGMNNSHAQDCIQSARSFVESMDAAFKKLGPEEWVVIYYLFMCHDVILFPFLLVTGRCTAQEYANGVMAGKVMLTTVFEEFSRNAHESIARGYREDAQVVLHYLEHARCPWTKEIFKGEDETREFKATLRYDLKINIYNNELEHSVLKNVAGFLNCDGGTIFVGVGDDGEIVGIELDEFENNDKWSLHLSNRIKDQIGKCFLTKCKIEFDLLHGKSVCRLTIFPSDEPAYLDERALKSKGGMKDAFFIRGGPSAQKLSPEEAVRYIAKRFPSASNSSPAS